MSQWPNPNAHHVAFLERNTFVAEKAPNRVEAVTPGSTLFSAGSAVMSTACLQKLYLTRPHFDSWLVAVISARRR